MTINADPEVYLAQASMVDNAGDRLATVADAAGSTNLDGGAFGVACAFVADSARNSIDALTEMIRQTQTVVADTGDVLRDIAADFATAEEEHVAALETLSAALP